MNLLDFNKRFPNEESCVNYLRQKREEEGVICPNVIHQNTIGFQQYKNGLVQNVEQGIV
jgi:hypothetical protein